MGLIYCLTNLVTGKKYVGKTTKTLEERIQKHLYSVKYKVDTHLYRSIRKYGIESFTTEVLVTCDDELLDETERAWIKDLGTLAPAGYNMTPGGEGGDMTLAPGYINRKILRGVEHPCYGKAGNMTGKSHSEETKQKQSSARQQHWDNKDLEYRKRFGEAISGCNNGMYGRKPPNSTKVKFEGVVYGSLSEAARASGRSTSFIKKHGSILS